MEHFNMKNAGSPWTTATVNAEPILKFYQNNGRIDISDESNPDIRFRMSEQIALKNKSTEYREAIHGLQEDNLLAKAYFSEANIQILQNGLRAGVYEMSDRKIVMPPQNLNNLKIIMRSMYLQHARYPEKTSMITKEIEKLNKYVLDYVVSTLYSEAQGYINYCKDQSTLVQPLERAQQVDRDYKHLEWKTWV